MRLHHGGRAVTVSLALALASCVDVSTVTLFELDCGSQRLRFEGTARDDRVSGFVNWSTSLLRSSGSGWERLDEASVVRGFGPETFSRLLPPDVAYRQIPFDAARPQGRSASRWIVFFDPAQVSRADYDVLSSCLAVNVRAIDTALARATRPGPQPAGDSMERHEQIAGTLHAAHDSGYTGCLGRTLGTRWDCADKRGYIKTVIDHSDGQLLLCREPITGPDGRRLPPQGDGRMVLGKISADQGTVVLREPSSWERETVFLGEDPMGYYAGCRDASGKALFDVLTPQPWRSPSAAPPRR